MYSPDRKKIFEESDVNAECHECSKLIPAPKKWDGGDYVCDAGCHSDCPRVGAVADEINQFIADNEDVLNLIQCVGE